MSFKATTKQKRALLKIGEGMFIMLFGGSRSGKTFIIIRSIIIRALAASGSSHAILRFRFNHCKASIVHDTFPKVMKLCFPDVSYHIDKTDWYCRFSNGSKIWFGGLDDKERTEKVLGQEHATIYLNESSQIQYSSYLLILTRLAQVCDYVVDGVRKTLSLKFFADCNPPSQAHWTYKLFIKKLDPETNKPIPDSHEYVHLQMNPKDNEENLSPVYLRTLQNLPKRMKLRFWEGAFGDITENALWNVELIDKWRTDEVPDMQRIIVGVDPSGADDSENQDNDAIGIVVGGLGTDGKGYLLEDLTVKAGPGTWGKIATTAFDRHGADLIVGEVNYGGEMVKFVVKTAKPDVPFKKVTASRGKVVRAEPISALTEDGKVRFAGTFADLEDELCSFTTAGFIGEKSPNRADAFIWVMSELFPGLVKQKKEKKETKRIQHYAGAGGWMQ